MTAAAPRPQRVHDVREVHDDAVDDEDAREGHQHARAVRAPHPDEAKRRFPRGVPPAAGRRVVAVPLLLDAPGEDERERVRGQADGDDAPRVGEDGLVSGPHEREEERQEKRRVK